MTRVSQSSMLRVRDHPRVRELTEKLDGVRSAQVTAKHDLDTVRARAAVAVQEAEVAEALAALGEENHRRARDLRAAAERLSAEVDRLEAVERNHAQLVKGLGEKLMLAEREAGAEIRARMIAERQELVVELDAALEAARRVNDRLVELHKWRLAEGQVGSRYKSLAWEALRRPRVHESGPPELRVQHWVAPQKFGVAPIEAWRAAARQMGHELPDRE